MKLIRLLLVLSATVSCIFAQNTAPLAPAPMGNPQVPFDTSKSFLIYTTNNTDLAAAMDYYDLNYTVRSADVPVTLNDLQTHDILIVGWNTGNLSTMEGLAPAIIDEGITGRIALTGHDADFHVTNAPDAGNEVFLQMIKFVLDNTGTGMVAFGDSADEFQWLPETWGIDATGGLAEQTVEAITEAGSISGIYDNLTPELLSNWDQSYHATFTDWDTRFEAFELASDSIGGAVTIGTPLPIKSILLTKTDNIPDGQCVFSNDEMSYTICYKNTLNDTLSNVILVDYLPYGVSYPAGFDTIGPDLIVIPGDPNYDPVNHTYTWEIGDLEPQTDPNVSPVCVSLDVVVNDSAEPGLLLHNVVEVVRTICYDMTDPEDPNNTITICNDQVIAAATEDTPICCYGDPNIIYVSEDASGADNGTGWSNAYSGSDGLQKALTRAWNSTCDGPFTIYIARGTYLPGTSEYDSFELPDGCQVYGGFPTGGCDFVYRNPKKYETVLSGRLGDYDFAYSVVCMGHESGISDTIISEGFEHNIYGNGVDFTVNNCVIKDSVNYGIYAEYGNVITKSCMIKNNGADGIFHESIANNLNVSNSWVMRNDKFGVECVYTTPIMYNSIISESDLAEEGYAGISIINPAYSPILHNLTISENKSVGLHFEDDQSSDPNAMLLDYPSIQNCIIFYNNDDGQQISGRINPSFANYSCIQDCNDVNPNNNINTVPSFAYVKSSGEPDPNNFHLAAGSLCRNAGNPNLDYSAQLDYDNESRIADDVIARVDIGADELYSCDGDYTEDEFANEFDWNADGIVNLKEFELFAASWLSIYPADIDSWNPLCNLDDTGNSQNIIDLADLTVFVNDVPWLWQACWYDNFTAAQAVGQAAMMSVPLESFSAVSSLSLDIESESMNMYDYYTNSELAQVVSDIYVIQYKVYELLDDPHNRKDKKDLQDMLDFFDVELEKIKETLQ